MQNIKLKFKQIYRECPKIMFGFGIFTILLFTFVFRSAIVNVAYSNSVILQEYRNYKIQKQREEIETASERIEYPYMLKNNGDIYYSGIIIAPPDSNYYSAHQEDYEIKIESADFRSFEIIKSYHYHAYAKDKNHVYFDSEIIPNVDPETFQITDPVREFNELGNYFYRTNNSVYWQKFLIDGFNPETARKLNNDYYVDDDQAFFPDNFTIIYGIDANTFEVLEEEYSMNAQEYNAQYAKDKNHVYFEGNILTDVDPYSFQTLSMDSYSNNYYTNYTKDKNNIYFNREIIEDVDPDSFVIMKTSDNNDPNSRSLNYGTYAKDKNHVYFLGKIMSGVDPQSAEFMGCEYLKTPNNIYLQGKIQPDIDPTNFGLQQCSNC